MDETNAGGNNLSFPEPKVPNLSNEETIVGVHQSGISLQEGMNTSLGRNYCSNCKKKIHCYVKVDRDTKEAIVHNTCKTTDCECKCKTHYACKQCGFLHPYGGECDRPEQILKLDPKNESIIEKINQEYRDMHKTQEVKTK